MVRYVLPNHQLFLLAEQPPTDMASLSRTFQHIPAILRRRSKELLDTIREAAKEVTTSHGDIPQATTPPPVADVVMTTAEEVKEELLQLTSTVQLWPSGKQIWGYSQCQLDWLTMLHMS